MHTQKKKRMAGKLISLAVAFCFIFMGFTAWHFLKQKEGTATVQQSFAPSKTQPLASVTPMMSDTGVLAAITTPTPSPTLRVQTPKPTMTTSTPSATPSPSSISSSQPALLDKTMKKYNLSYTKLIGNQLLLLVYDHGTSKLYRYQKDSQGIWKLVGNPYAAQVGRNGVSANKKEGDGKTPTGLYRLGFAFGNESKPDTVLTYRKVTTDSYWVDDSNSKFYNTWVEGTEQKDWDSAEHLSEAKTAYAYAVVIEYNMNPIKPGLGSAIFLHCGTKPTAGCIAVDKSRVLEILKWLKGTSKPQILITQTD